MVTVRARGGWRWLSIVVMVLGMAPGAQAGPVTDQFKDDIAKVFRVIEVSGIPRAGAGGIDVSARREAILSAADPFFDWREMASRALARHWSARSDAERLEFVKIFRDLVQRAYITQLERYNGEAIKFISERVEGDLAVLGTRFVSKESQELPVEYRLINRDGRWRVYDVMVEGVSLVNNYRSQFDKVIRNFSYPELVKRLKDREIAFR